MKKRNDLKTCLQTTREKDVPVTTQPAEHTNNRNLKIDETMSQMF